MSTTTATPSRQRRSTAQPERRSSRSTDTVATTTTRRRAHSSPVRRRGSQQQLTVRGRRVAVREPRNRTMMWTVVLMLALLVAGDSNVIDVLDGLLTLKGLCLIYGKNAG